MSRYKRHIFVCLNERPKDHPKGCCLTKESAGVRDALKAELVTRKIAGTVRVNNAGCLDACAFGPSLVIYPEGIWYGGVTRDDVAEIVERTLINGEVIERLLIRDERYRPPGLQLTPLDSL